MGRYEELRKILTERRFFKLVCGAGNEDAEQVRKLSMIYTLAGAHMLDLSANVEVVRAAKNGIEAAYEIAPKLNKDLKVRPFLNVSIGIKGDPHVRKAKIDLKKCTKCGKCIKACRQEAITEKFKVLAFKCIGCGDCDKVCKFDAIIYTHRKTDFQQILPECIKEGVETLELHAVTDDDRAVFEDWKLLNGLINNNYLSMCMDRQVLSNEKFIERVKKAYEITGERLIIQADGVPMGGEGDDFNTTLQAVACADILKKSRIPVMVLLSGGTNSRTGLLAKQCGVSANGIAVGSWARKIMKDFINRSDIDHDIDMIRKAVSVAEQLIKVNIEAISSGS